MIYLSALISISLVYYEWCYVLVSRYNSLITSLVHYSVLVYQVYKNHHEFTEKGINTRS